MIGHHHLDHLRQHLVVPLILAVNSAASANLVVPGPPAILLWGVTIPTVSALFGVVGVVVGQWLAPASAEPLGCSKRSALMIALQGIALGIVMATGQQPLVAMGWGIGLGFSGLSVMQALGDEAMSGLKRISDAFITRVAAMVGGKNKDGAA